MSGLSYGPFSFGNMPITVPADYVCLTIRGWPVTNGSWHEDVNWPATVSPSPPNGIYGSTRTWDTGGGCNQWNIIETSAGVYDSTQLALLDQIFTAHRSQGRTVLFQVYGTPQFYIANSDPNKSVPDAFGINGGFCAPVTGAPSNGLTGLSNFVTMILQRYNRPGVGTWNLANPTLGKGINWVECWNEFETSSGYWKGTVGNIVDVCYTIRQAVQAVDNTVITLFASSNDVTQTANALNSFGTTNSTKKGSDGCDAVAIHIYDSPLPYTYFGSNVTSTAFDMLNSIYKGFIGIKFYMGTTSIPNADIYITECGIGYESSGSGAVPGTALDLACNTTSAKWRHDFWARCMMMGAAWGYKMWDTYCWERVFSCTPMNDTEGVQKALKTIHQNVAGKTITSGQWWIGGEVSLKFSDGTTLTI